MHFIIIIISTSLRTTHTKWAAMALALFIIKPFIGVKQEKKQCNAFVVIHGFQGQQGRKVKVDIRCHYPPSLRSGVQDAVSSAHSCVVACAELTLRCQFPMGKKQTTRTNHQLYHPCLQPGGQGCGFDQCFANSDLHQRKGCKLKGC